MARMAVHGGGTDRKVWDVAIKSDFHKKSLRELKKIEET